MSAFLDQLIRASPLTSSLKVGTPNLSLYAVPALWVVSMSAHFYAASIAPTPEGFDNCSPRGYLSAISAKAKRTPADEKYIRAEAAQQNGHENMGFFAAAIVAANIARLPVADLNFAAALYLASRVAYNILYITATDKALAAARSIAFLVGVGVNFTLFIRAGLALQ